MMEILNLIMKETDIRDPMLISTSKVTATLMSIINSQATTQGFLVSGYPRSMRDTKEYLETVGRLDGVILLNWTEKTLQTQIEYGAKFGQVVYDVAKLELANFRQHVLPVAEYFDYKHLLYVIPGERKPENVYTDFVSVFKKILSSNHKAN
ncbi:adenylate kinase isoenzyme 5 [Eurytemora carolleeae]|uniref:adenylate kinase isoenzyme 5 n=1 Tax=Eurytemora carolleeae TaxID=1294199 RepID=UPI000C78B472|nr:adenylate kinase isoenzyme 5 [Eurytemora carolleeae]|eukprot:XP_023340810.1 adenylate kinase isoenzyme 5-like [Eurytemora affinis]